MENLHAIHSATDLGILPSVLLLICTAIVVVVIFKFLRLSPVLGYLVAGGLIGDHGFRIVTSNQVSFLAECGVVFLLFAIGLELSFERLKVMRKYVFGLGSLQVILTSLVVGLISSYFLKDNSTAFIIGCGLALSSTAIVLQVLEENHHQNTQLGRISLAILLQQDFIVVPLLVIVPLLSQDSKSIAYAVMISFSKAIVSLLVIFICGRLFLRPIFRLISSDSVQVNNEIFIAATLLICLSAAWTTEALGLSMALGAFIAGILVAETEFRLPAEDSIYPFKGLLLGLFFMSVGMQINIIEMYKELGSILFFSFSLILIKALIIAGLCRLFAFSKGVSVSSGLLLAQGGEFGFILFNLAMTNGVISHNTGRVLLLVVTCTMALTPLLAMLGNKLADFFDNKRQKNLDITAHNTSDLKNHVVIAGFGEVGAMAAKMMKFQNLHYVVVDIDKDVVQTGSEQGVPIFKGDVSQIETLEALSLERASVVIITIRNTVTVKRALSSIAANFPNVNIIIRSPNLKNANALYKAGAHLIIPDHYENGLQLGGAALKHLGISDYEVARIKGQFRANLYSINKENYEEYVLEKN